MASPSRQDPLGGSGLLQGGRARSYGSLVQSACSPVRERRLEHPLAPGDTLAGLALKYGVTSPETSSMVWILRKRKIEKMRYSQVRMKLGHPQRGGRNESRVQDVPMVQPFPRLARNPPPPSMTSLPLISLRSLIHRSACQRRLLPRS
ncbi:LysM domain containing 1 [Phyllostomus discolor]|uniref:LysM domain containing 1 n=1 Tax=Phyllostomus discolor TaxID=89673 RepID=A0A834DDN0_9CHIR|nr:LysM domain containing 1 [Phyllostomus discolor]